MVRKDLEDMKLEPGVLKDWKSMARQGETDYLEDGHTSSPMNSRQTSTGLLVCQSQSVGAEGKWGDKEECGES